MKRRFVIGEVNSGFFVGTRSEKIETLSLLKSGDPIKEKEGINRHQNRTAYFNSLPNDTRWYVSTLPIDKSQFDELWTLKGVEEWMKYTNSSYKLCDAAKFLNENPNEDERVGSIISALETNHIELTGITFMAQAEDGPFVIVEGTGRLVAIYCKYIIKGISDFENNEIDVVVGLSKKNWYFWPFPKTKMAIWPF